MSLVDRLLGRPLSTEEGEEHKIRVWEGIPFLGLDALASAAYGPEAALTLLLPLGVLGLSYALPIMLVILAILGILFLSYWQTITAYQGGGGSYTVARENLGETASLFAGSALILDYTLDVAVGISAGVGALVSAVPGLHRHILALTLVILLVVALVNLRGVRASGSTFALPTYLFIASLGWTLIQGLINTVNSGGHPTPAIAEPTQGAGQHMASLALVWLVLRAFASGCTAMTGVEAISNGVPNFAAPAAARAKKTLAVVVGVLAVLLLGITLLCQAYHIGATDPDSPQYQSIISQLTSAVFGRNWFYYVTLGSTLAVLALSANTGFADFPRLCRMLAQDEYLPRSFINRGRRLVFTIGIVVLTVMTAILLIVFGGVTDRLIPLFAIGAFLAFTLSQFGMVAHWAKHPQGRARFSMAINFLGGICTAVALVIIAVAKFAEGAWITLLLIPALVVLFRKIKAHYNRVAEEIATDVPLTIDRTAPLVVVPMKDWNRITSAGLSFALRLSEDVHAVHVMADEEIACRLEVEWHRLVELPCVQVGLRPPKLVVLPSPFRRLVSPLLSYVRELTKQNPSRPISVIVPELQEMKWYQVLLHNQRATSLKAALLFYGDRRVNVINVPWYFMEEHTTTPGDWTPRGDDPARG